jgi:hypothetical protein
MTKNTVFRFLLVCFLLFSTTAFAQKVKYKDIYGLLSTKQYEVAEPFLKRYLKDNDDNPNAFMFMGLIFQEKALKMDVLKQTAAVVATMDSSVMFFDMALKTIDEREVKKNKEYYEAYNRRDLRTGEFGVKLSDITFDIDKRVQAMKERIVKVKMTSTYFALSDSLYSQAVRLYKNIEGGMPSQRQLYLRADETTLKDLTSLALKFDSCTKAFETYKSGSASLGHTGYKQNLTLVEIVDMKKDGMSKADFFKDDLKLWDYKKFAEAAKSIIEKDIIPMRSHLVSYDIEINKLREKLNNDSISVRSDLTKLIDVLLYEQLKKYDPEPLPMEVFSMKTADLEYRSALLEHKPFRDSSDIHMKLLQLESEQKSLHKLDSISGKLTLQDIDQEAIDYGYFITTAYSNTIVLHSYIKSMHEFAQREKKAQEERLTALRESLKWIVDGADSVPLVKDVPSKTFVSLHTESEKYTVGLAFKDSLTADGYLYTVTPSRTPALKARFPVEKGSFRRSTAVKGDTRALAYADPEGHVYYVLIVNSKGKDSKFPVTVAKIYKTDGLAWTNNYSIAFVPNTISFKPETSELTVSSESQQMVIDKNGKMIK